MVDEKLAQNRKRYEKKRVQKHVSFNSETEKDLLAFADSVDFSQWVKAMIRERLGGKPQPQSS
ncbi:Uncharacterised protein [Kingella potus]|uniref:Uncharacterized protein n=1 Tax=Kingella potus TaxID=265175 RepID=A0A377QYN0_9NEIS|nr:hypothetical protein [Kingella potus]UOP00532.1 hypothetical protein LVJ84_11925 [Kingella potus]UOP02018.1 hypothetical protein LVJ84_14285 [Kingella potus]STQ99850.1 Uncharacterised protein [Kingella potus]